MKKSILLIVLSLFTIVSCEKDEICIDSTTPLLLIRFNDNDDKSEYKSILLDSVWIEDKDLYFSNETEEYDSIYLPFDINEDFTNYKLAAEGLIDDMNVKYTQEDVFVGRSCGYKTIFDDLELVSNTNEWIKDIEINYTTIDNDTIAAITIFH